MSKLIRADLCVVLCLLSFGCGQRELRFGTAANELPTDALDTAESKARSCACGPPNGGLWATFQVGSETFKQKITNPTAIADAIAVWQGQSNKHIPVGSLRCSCSGWNCGWSFTMDPATLVMASSAIEICDGLPSYVNQTCPSFGGGSYCPWSAVMVDLRDCRTNPACPVMSR